MSLVAPDAVKVNGITAETADIKNETTQDAAQPVKDEKPAIVKREPEKPGINYLVHKKVSYSINLRHFLLLKLANFKSS